MVELDAIPEAARERVESIGATDLVIGLPACASDTAVETAVAGLRAVLPTIANGLKVVVVHPDGVPQAPAGSPEPPDAGPSLRLLPYPLSPIDRYAEQTQPDPLRSVLLIGQQLGARASALLHSEPGPALASDLRRLAQPVLEQNFDLAVPRYARRKFDSLINSSIVYPLTRALYGKRIQYPMASDLVFSSRLADRCLQPEPGQRRPVPLAWITNKAACGGFQVAQVNFGLSPPPKDSVDLSVVLSQVLGSLFLDMDRNAACWQKSRGSQTVRSFGAVEQVADESRAVEVRKMIETFQLGYRNLLEIWGVVLSPATLLELKKLTAMPPELFRLQDDLWVRLIYDCALAYRLRAMNRDHLLRAMTPVYLAWVASYALEVQDAGPAQVENRLERLCVAFETHKPLLVSRWRWPDRFNP
ncbi:MAG: hypothetical protein ACRD9L_06395 [Bryobacteraceae bacterium]